MTRCLRAEFAHAPPGVVSGLLSTVTPTETSTSRLRTCSHAGLSRGSAKARAVPASTYHPLMDQLATVVPLAANPRTVTVDGRKWLLPVLTS